MLSVDEALARLLTDVTLLPGEPASLVEAVGRVPVAATMTALVDVPPFANSAMDGFAVRSADLPGRLPLAGEVLAGSSDLPSLTPGSTLRIMTGAPLPPGADAVVPLERTVEESGTVTFASPVRPGADVRPAGHDTAVGDEIALPTPLTPAGIAVLASLGITEIDVRRRPRVAVVTTGDELAAAGRELAPGQIHDANGPAVAAAVTEAGGTVIVYPGVPDDLEVVEAALAEAAEADLVLVAGGVSVGRRDFVREAIEHLGSLDFWRIAMQPGKPVAIGRIGSTPVIGLPGNPVSALVVTELFARPLLRAMVGLTGDGRRRVKATLEEEIPKDPERRAYLRVVLHRTDAGWAARPAGGQLSSQLRALAAADALLIVPEGEPAGRVGATYQALLLREL